jgi:hypothetical protein
MNRAQALHYRKSIEDAAALQSDEKALENIYLYPRWEADIDVAAGDRYRDEGTLYKCIQPHHTQADWQPHLTPALWVVVSIEEWPEIPENIPSTAPWMKGDKGTWKGEHYICNLDNCVWNPDVAPSFWIKQ